MKKDLVKLSNYLKKEGLSEESLHVKRIVKEGLRSGWQPFPAGRSYIGPDKTSPLKRPFKGKSGVLGGSGMIREKIGENTVHYKFLISKHKSNDKNSDIKKFIVRIAPRYGKGVKENFGKPLTVSDFTDDIRKALQNRISNSHIKRMLMEGISTIDKGIDNYKEKLGNVKGESPGFFSKVLNKGDETRVLTFEYTQSFEIVEG